MAEKRRGLGRGLGALISSSPVAEEATTVPTESAVVRDSVPAAGERSVVSRETRDSGTPDAAGPVSGKAATPVGPEIPAAGDTPQEGSSPHADSITSMAASKAAATEDRNTSMPAKTAVESVGQEPSKMKGAAQKAGPRKPRPVDMFFTPGMPEDAEVDTPKSTDGNAQDRDSPSRGRAKRTEMPDLIGAVRRRDTAASDHHDDRDDKDGKAASSQPAVPLHAGPTASKDPRIPSDGVSRETLVDVPGAFFAELAVGDIHPNRKQPRSVFDEDDMAELVHSVREVGLLQPIVVRPSEEEGQRYELVMGERRWRAVQQAGLETIPAIVRETSNVDLLRDALLENLHRSQLNPLEEAAAYQQLLQEFDCTQEELSDRIGRSRPQISNTIRLMKLPALVQRRVAAGVLSAGHARALLALADPGDMERIAQRIVNEGLSVRATEEVVALSDGLRRPPREAPARSIARHERLDYLANSLSDRLDTNVKITLGAKKGRVSIEFASVDDLNRIMGVISPTSAG